VSEILKVFKLAENYRMPEMQVRSGRVHAKFHSQRLALGAGFLELGSQLGFANYFRAAFFYVG
jgi:hypothetical protein